jgi:hypothetical protein
MTIVSAAIRERSRLADECGPVGPMNPRRPIDPEIFAFVCAWLAMALFIGACLIYAASRSQSLVGKFLYLIGGLGLLAVPAAIALSFMSTAWYGGKPDPAASVDGRFYVRTKHRLTPVSEYEYHRLQHLHAHENWYRGPCVVGLACIALGRLLKPRGADPSEPAPANAEKR